MQTTQSEKTTSIPPTARPRPEDMIPPEELSICFGGGDFLKLGTAIMRRLVEGCDLAPHERVLDIGCGIGRAAVPLTAYLSDQGRYEGFDTYPFGIHWANEHISPHYPNFRFRFVDVYNSLYNPMAATRARDFVFPYPNASFDVAVLNSVFTHMLPEDVLGYLGQIERVLAPGGRALCTWFLMNDEARAALDAHPGTAIRLEHARGSFFMDNPEDPEEAVGYAERFARAMVLQAGLGIKTVSYGNWCGRAGSHYQDYIVVTKE